MRTQKNIINLYKDKNIFNVKQVVSIANEDDLNLFWHFVINSENSAHNLIHTFLTQFYNFVLLYLHKEDAQFFEIILEENDKYFYFTLWNKKTALLFKEYIEKTSLNFLYDDTKLSLRLNKVKFQKNIEKLNEKHQKNTQNIVKSIVENQPIKKRNPYNFIDDEDLQELLKLNDDMQELIFYVKKNALAEDIFISLRSSISLFCLTLRYYERISTISTTITEFSNLLNLHKEKFLALNKDELSLVCGFVNNIDTWLQNLFVQGGAQLYFMDNSMKADLQTIITMIEPQSCIDENNLEAIFDF